MIESEAEHLETSVDWCDIVDIKVDNLCDPAVAKLIQTLEEHILFHLPYWLLQWDHSDRW